VDASQNPGNKFILPAPTYGSLGCNFGRTLFIGVTDGILI